MHSYYHLATIVLLLTATVVVTTHAFNISPQLLSHRPATALFGGKRRGRLTNNVSLDEDGNVARIMTKREKQKLGSSKMKKKNASSSSTTISPLLAEWAKDNDNSSSTSSSKESSTPSTTTVSTSATTFIPFDNDNNNETTNKKKRKANKRAQRAALNAIQTQQIDTLLEQINDMLQTTNLDRVELVSLIKSLVTFGSSSSSNNNDQVLLPTLKSIVSTRPGKDETSPSYRLAWVGSDNAICHIGTSLHKVPLARLQEVFLTLGYNRWELYEVIRIIGPFPNVRNTLKGDVKLNKLSSSSYEREGVRMEISYTSMIDGTGKEILAGKEDNIKYVNLDVWFANEKVIVCTVPSEGKENDDGNGEDPFTGDGFNVLFFVGEENLDEQLEKLRAA